MKIPDENGRASDIKIIRLTAHNVMPIGHGRPIRKGGGDQMYHVVYAQCVLHTAHMIIAIVIVLTVNQQKSCLIIVYLIYH